MTRKRMKQPLPLPRLFEFNTVGPFATLPAT
jgi:hypothetical protein